MARRTKATTSIAYPGVLPGPAPALPQGPLTPAQAGLLRAWAARGAGEAALRRGRAALLTGEGAGLTTGRYTLRGGLLVCPDPRKGATGSLAVNRQGIIGRI